jgi:hypothetical protein
MHPTVTRVIDPLMSGLDAALGDRYALLLFGSAAREDFVPGFSDLNLLLVAERLDPVVLRALSPVLARWRKTGNPPPLLLTVEELARSADAFPLEIHDLIAAHVVLRGRDPLAGLKVQAADLRRALERDARGKLLRLRQGYAEAAGNASAVTALARLSAGGVLLLLRAGLALGGTAVPAAPPAMMEAAGRKLAFDPAPLMEVAGHRSDARWRCTPECFESYLAIVERVVRFLDELNTGEQ